MASQQRSMKIPADLALAAEIRAALLQYGSWGGYIKGLIRHDLTVQDLHDLTLPISRLTIEEQNLVDAELLKATRKGIGLRGVMLKGVLFHLDKGLSIYNAIAQADRFTPAGNIVLHEISVSRVRTLKIPADLAEAAERRAQILTYASWSAYIKGLIRYDLMAQGPHDHTLPIARLPLGEQDKFDAELLAATKSGVGTRSQLLKHIRERLKND